jgi:hypothetical protein
MQACHPAAISTSGGRLAALTRRFVFARPLVERGDAVASASTNPSSSASGSDLFT